ncbi:helix-turn-helix transcriptional regulator [Streptomyces profundus]|uniref:helix-turn-helix transcriptional regulator n=1 Tax=Streptomyces profundus TaxID=2867410 RepID=UPI001D167AD5|nr:helix-turn-helix transcriptional regulator [Streptomyces sp. MA3_2.13]UED86496.1 helix-turn-helix transcriptional regulator [Streptomyces sp. MA3_2.13]
MRTNHPRTTDPTGPTPLDGPETGVEGEDLGEALLEVRALLDNILARHRDQLSGHGAITTIAASPAVFEERVRGWCADARQCLEAVIAPDQETGRIIDAALRATCSRDECPLPTRVLTTQTQHHRGRPTELHGPAQPISWRVAPVPPMQLLLVDRTAALIHVESALGQRSAVVRDPTLVGMLLALFEGLWHRASPPDAVEFDGRGGPRLARQVLRALSEGVTDEVAAAGLGMSLRTFRRHVADLMTVLGAKTRFQAGVLAAEVGLLRPPADPG